MSALQMILNNASMRVAMAGKVDGTLNVAGRANYIYARFGADDATTEFECHAGAIVPGVDDALLVMLENPAQPRSWRMVFWLREA